MRAAVPSSESVRQSLLAYTLRLPEEFIPWPGQELAETVLVDLDVGVSMSKPCWRWRQGADGERVGGVTLHDSDRGPILIHDGTAEAVRLVTPGEFAGTDTPDHRHRIRPGDGVSHGYLQRLDDGFVWYRNPTPDKEPDTVGERNFSITASGNTCGSVRLRHLADGIALIDLPDHPTLRLDKRSPELFSSATGEVLDLTRETPRYANIRLHSQ
ncbi:MAG: hypothetical protein WKF76_03790 [Nocardioidaceae bacterium]